MAASATTLNQYLEHAVLAPDSGAETVLAACRMSRERQLLGLVVHPSQVTLAAAELRDSNVRLISVAGFPSGAHRTETKVVEAVRAAIDGAREIDLVANIGWLKDHAWSRAESEIAELRRVLPEIVVLKVIVEAPLLDFAEQQAAARLVAAAGAQFVKSGTGFAGPCTDEQVRILAEATDGMIGVKAAGGIRTAAQCERLLAAGASRLGTSSSAAILDQLRLK